MWQVREAKLVRPRQESDGSAPLLAFDHNKDDQLYKVSPRTINSQAVVFSCPCAGDRPTAVYQRLFERLSWIERVTSLKEPDTQ